MSEILNIVCPYLLSLNITVNYFSTKYTKHSAGCPSLPPHMKVKICPMDELPCYTEGGDCLSENEDVGLDNNDEECEEATSSSKISGETSPPGSECNIAADHHHYGTVKMGNERGCVGEDEVCREESNCTTLPARSSSSSSTNAIEVAEDTELDGAGRQQTKAADTNHEFPGRGNNIIACDIEVIDVSTPSPLCRTSSRSKRRRVSSTVWPEIIDLTKSPTFIQL